MLIHLHPGEAGQWEGGGGHGNKRGPLYGRENLKKNFLKNRSEHKNNKKQKQWSNNLNSIFKVFFGSPSQRLFEQ